VYGPEPCLAREVVAAHRAGSGPDQAVTFFAGETPERDIWDTLLSYPSPGGRRAVVYEADKLRNLDLAADLVRARGMDAAVTVFVSSEPDLPSPGSLAALKSSRDGQVVRCCAPSSLEDRVALVASWWPGATPNLGYEVLSRCGSLEDAWRACEQARLAELKPVSAMVGMVCSGAATGDLADLLMAGDKPGAMSLAAELPRAEVPSVIGLLEYRLSLAQQLGAVVRSGLSPREAAAELRVDRFIAAKVGPHAAAYDASRVRRLRGVLAGADAACRSGAAVGVAESVIALW
jgi:hypothetical protein